MNEGARLKQDPQLIQRSQLIQTPPWFPAGQLDARERLETTIDGARVSALLRPAAPLHEHEQEHVQAALDAPTVLGTPGVPVVLVHGGGASAVWWDACVAVIHPIHQVIAVDLSGHGGSDWRERYCAEQWIEEVLALVEGSSSAGAILIGHSLGGAIAVGAASRDPQWFSRVVTIDGNPVGPPQGAVRASASHAARRQVSMHPDLLTQRFLDAKVHWPAWVARHVAERSVEQVVGGWRYTRDLATFAVVPPATERASLPIPPLAYLHGSDSRFYERDFAYVSDLRADGYGVENRVIDAVGHEVMMQAPVESMRAIAGMLGGLLRLTDL